jgi:Flp pilus assembly protein TadG
MNNKQGGATVVEFALVIVVFSMFLLGLLDFGRLLFTWNAANEATRAGARYATVCADTGNSSLVLAKMKSLLPEVTTAVVAWEPAGCTAATCEGVTVSITGLNHRWLAPIAGQTLRLLIPMPTFSTYLPREMMRQDPLIDCS